MKIMLRLFTIPGLLLLLTACSGPLVMTPMLEEAEAEFETVSQDSTVLVYAPVALVEAEEELERSRLLWEARADRTLIDHHAYLAKQKAAIAKETANLNQAQVEIERAEPDRQRVLIDLRRDQALRAEQRAEQALEEARRERQEAERARERAEELAARVNELEAQQTERGLVLTLGDVLFDFDRAELKPGGQRAVAELAQFLNEYPERNVMIEGFTDSIGSEEYNQNLSLRRANSVQRALINRGISSNRIETVGYGVRYPVATNQTESGRQQNRRVEVIISDQSGSIPVREN
ncbi:OmpA family protein [Rhodohalobacter halophilus]|uniref:OmpA family protein n=1 Tax=Rhodohalobacter halophilus TaxID=1812810 RepID=UPI00083FCDE2|nr:OmpA family protein [Rhodohalobacter halophilus]